MARATKCTPEVQEKILQALRLGCTDRAAAAYAGVDRFLFATWKGYARQGKAPYAAFFERVQQAYDQAELSLVRMIHVAAAEDWRAGAWLLSRRYHADYGDRIRVEQVDQSELDREIRELLGQLAPGEATRLPGPAANAGGGEIP